MSVSRVREYLTPWALQDRIREFTVSSATVDEAAAAVGCEPARIAKTLSFLVGGKAVLIVMAGDAKVDNAKFKAFFHQKATMLPPDSVQELTGYAVGGVCPFALPEGASVYLDASLKRFETVFPSAGSSQSAVEMSTEELRQSTRASGWVDVGKGWGDVGDV